MEPLVKLLTLPQQERTYFWTLRFNGNFTKIHKKINQISRFKNFNHF